MAIQMGKHDEHDEHDENIDQQMSNFFCGSPFLDKSGARNPHPERGYGLLSRCAVE